MYEIYSNFTYFDNMHQGDGGFVQTHSFLAEKKTQHSENPESLILYEPAPKK